MRGAVAQHLDPLEKADKYKRDGSFAMSIKQINAISPILSRRLQLSEKEVNYLLAFLSALNYQPMNVDALVPKSVPSGLVVEYK